MAEISERFLSGEDQSRKLLVNGARDLVLKGLGLIGFLIMNAVLARGLGVEAFGHYAFVLSVVLLLSMAARQGMDSGILRFVSVYSAQQKWGFLKGVLVWMTIRVGVVALVVSFIGFAVLLVAGSLAAPGLRETGFWGLIFLPLVTLSQINQYALRGRLWIVRAQIPDLVIRPYGVSLVVSLLLWTGVSVDGGDAMAITAVSAAVGLVLGWVWLRNSMPGEVFSVAAEHEPKAWRQVSTQLLLVSGAGFVLTQMDIVMLGLLTTTDQSGLYSIASRLSAISIFAIIALGSIGAPMIASLYAREDTEALSRLVKLMARISLATLVPMGLLFAVFGPVILSFFGDQFVVVYIPLLVLVGGQTLAACFGPAAMLLTMTSAEDTAARVLLFSVVANLMLNGLLIPQFGMLGASIATALTTAIPAGVMFFAVRQRLGISSTAF
ncbi:MAG: polysaccharide biosynthesis C-terminal domain-containing protein [Parvibaculaceae bacterium]|nr:polysaccharide biosynthesis C-terminal domain-containing protein [Parvibaculaceae bacterium]